MTTNSSSNTIELWLKILTLCSILLGSVWAYITYTDTKEKEFYTTYWNKKLELFLETSNAASNMATTTSYKKFNESRETFWNLFYGRLSLVEGDDVKLAMEEFSKLVPKADIDSTSHLPMGLMQQPAYRLTIKLKEELGKAWREPFSELHEEN